jgi:heat shock protein HtpX
VTFVSRALLFLLANLGVMAVLSISLRVLGVDAWLAQQGMAGQFNGLLIMAAIMGFGGSFISLAMSKWMAKSSMGVDIIEQPRNEAERWLVETVRRQAEAAGIGMPEVGVFHSPSPNAFATGMNKDDALVAVSTGLLEHMNADEVEAVLGHEISHVANGDMVTMGLLQGVLNTFVVFFSRVAGLLIDSMLRGRSQEQHGHSGPGPGYWIASIVAELVLGLVANLIAMWFSRRREYRADAGGAQLAGRQKMIAALRALQRAHDARQPLPGELAAFGVDGGSGGLAALFLSHPPLEQRIAALEAQPD